MSVPQPSALGHQAAGSFGMKRRAAADEDSNATAATASKLKHREVIQIDSDEDEESAATITKAEEEEIHCGPATKRRRVTAPASTAAAAAASSSLVPSRTAVGGGSALSFHSSTYWSYFPSAVPASTASRLFTALRAMVDPVPGRIFVYGREHTENRLTKVYARKAGSFKYSGTEKVASGEWPPEIEELYQIAVQKRFLDRSRLSAKWQRDSAADTAAAASAASDPSASASSAAPYFWDTVLINYYRSGNDSISWHSDKDSATFPIASFSFGAEREFQIRERPPRGSKSTKQLRACSSVLSNGSLLLMWPGMQERYHHAVPKRAGVSNGRVNVTFRLHHRMDQ